MSVHKAKINIDMTGAVKLLEKSLGKHKTSALMKFAECNIKELRESACRAIMEVNAISRVKDRNIRSKALLEMNINITKWLEWASTILEPSANLKMFYTLVELESVFSRYIGAESSFKKNCLKSEVSIAQDYETFMEDVSMMLNKTFKYEVDFRGKMKLKMQDSLNWLGKSLVRAFHYNEAMYNNERLNEVAKADFNKMLEAVDSETEWNFANIPADLRKEAMFWNELYARLSLAKSYSEEAARIDS